MHKIFWVLFLRCFSSYDDMNLKRRTSLPLVRSQSFQLSGKEGIIHIYNQLISSVTLDTIQSVLLHVYENGNHRLMLKYTGL